MDTRTKRKDKFKINIEIYAPTNVIENGDSAEPDGYVCGTYLYISPEDILDSNRVSEALQKAAASLDTMLLCHAPDNFAKS